MGERYECGTLSHVICTVTGLAGARSSRKLIGLSGANGMAGRGLRVTWAAGEAERRKQSVTNTHTCHTHMYRQRTTLTHTPDHTSDLQQEVPHQHLRTSNEITEGSKLRNVWTNMAERSQNCERSQNGVRTGFGSALLLNISVSF